ncbi:hypothetical protein GQ600_7480 [Phytophthora cactorum]|nr:hypothetical protein GQ600_7480 [Phytophthora cactorum]
MAKENQATENTRRSIMRSKPLYLDIVEMSLPDIVTMTQGHHEWWHGPSESRRSGGICVRTRAASQSGYRFYRGITEDSRLDFDEELLGEDSWQLECLAGEFEVEAILDDRSHSRRLLRCLCASSK